MGSSVLIRVELILHIFHILQVSADSGVPWSLEKDSGTRKLNLGERKLKKSALFAARAKRRPALGPAKISQPLAICHKQQEHP